MEVSLRSMSEYFDRSRLVVGWEEQVAETLEAADILHRMQQESIIRERHGFANFRQMTEDEKTECCARISADEESDLKRLGELIAGMQCWWD